MAGSYRHITTDSGKFCGTKYLDHMGDAHGALEECYGMIQWLADQLAGTDGLRDTPDHHNRLRKEYIKLAEESYKDGLKIGGMTKKLRRGD